MTVISKRQSGKYQVEKLAALTATVTGNFQKS